MDSSRPSLLGYKGLTGPSIRLFCPYIPSLPDGQRKSPCGDCCLLGLWRSPPRCADTAAPTKGLFSGFQQNYFTTTAGPVNGRSSPRRDDDDRSIHHSDDQTFSSHLPMLMTVAYKNPPTNNYKMPYSRDVMFDMPSHNPKKKIESAGELEITPTSNSGARVDTRVPWDTFSKAGGRREHKTVHRRDSFWAGAGGTAYQPDASNSFVDELDGFDDHEQAMLQLAEMGAIHCGHAVT